MNETAALPVGHEKAWRIIVTFALILLAMDVGATLRNGFTSERLQDVCSGLAIVIVAIAHLDIRRYRLWFIVAFAALVASLLVRFMS